MHGCVVLILVFVLLSSGTECAKGYIVGQSATTNTYEDLGTEFTPVAGETVRVILSLRDEPKSLDDTDRDLLVLTDLRVAHIKRTEHSDNVSVMSLPEVVAFEIARQRSSGLSGYIWGGLAFVAALLVWQIWEQPVLDLVAGLVLGAMGVYLILDQYLDSVALTVEVKAGSSQLQLQFDKSVDEKDLYNFFNLLFEVKANSSLTAMESEPCHSVGMEATDFDKWRSESFRRF